MYSGDQFSKLCSKGGQAGDRQNLGVKNHFQKFGQLNGEVFNFWNPGLEISKQIALPVK